MCFACVFVVLVSMVAVVAAAVEDSELSLFPLIENKKQVSMFLLLMLHA